MNVKRVVVAAVVAWVISIPCGFLVQEVILKGLFAANAAAFRPEPEMMAKVPFGIAATLLGFLAFAYIYAKGYEGGNGIAEGVRFGLVAGTLVNAFGVIWFWVMFPIDSTLGVAMLIDGYIEPMLYGAIVGAIYKPAAVAVTRRVAV